MRVIFSALLLLCCVFSLQGCNGASSDSDNNNNQIAQTATSLELSLYSQNQPLQGVTSNNHTITATALLLDDFKKPIAGKVISFSTTIGALTPATALTNSDGEASVQLLSDGALGAGTIKVTYLGLQAETNFELLAPVDDSQNLPSLSLAILVDGVSNNQFNADQSAQIVATLTSGGGQPIANEIILFSAELGQLAMTSVLTDSNGQAMVALNAIDAQLGAGQLTASLRLDGSDNTVSHALNYQINPVNNGATELIRLGYFDGGNFVEGKLGLTLAQNDANLTISAGASAGVALTLLDSQGQRVMTPYQVSFSANCVNSGKASLDATAFTINGTAHATFEDRGCGGNNGTSDVIVASVSINGVVETVSQVINIASEQLGSIEFIAASPESIVLKGTGGVNQSSTSQLTFKVSGQLGNPLANQLVQFSLNTSTGGIGLSPLESYTNSQGLVSTKVTAGNVPAVIRVTATSSQGTEKIATLSDLLTINTGLPDQNSLTLSADTINVEGGDLFNTNNTITAFLADSFNNPVVDGTQVNFTAEGGQIQPRCTTVNGSCSVTWISAEPVPADHRVTILATADGHETFYDTNGNNLFDNNDGNAISDNNLNSGLDRALAKSSGFMDMSEAWRDDNENRQFDGGELFLDQDNSGSFSLADGKFNGPQCEGNRCSNQTTLYIRKAVVIVTASSAAKAQIATGSLVYLALNQNPNGTFIASPTLNEGAEQSFTLTYADLADQNLAFGTSINITTSAGELAGETSRTVGNEIGRVKPSSSFNNSMRFSIKNTNDPANTGDVPIKAYVTVTITSPSGVITQGQFELILAGS